MGGTPPKAQEVSLLKPRTAPSPLRLAQRRHLRAMTRMTRRHRLGISPMTSSTASSPTTPQFRLSRSGGGLPHIGSPTSRSPSSRAKNLRSRFSSLQPSLSFKPEPRSNHFRPQRQFPSPPSRPCRTSRCPLHLSRLHRQQPRARHSPKFRTRITSSSRVPAPRVCRRWRGCQCCRPFPRTSRRSSRSSISPRRH